MEEKIVPPKHGVFVLDGLIKIERFDDLNYIVKIKSDKPVSDKRSVTKKNNICYIYKSDGYVQYGKSYFQSLRSALAYIANKVIPDLALKDGDLEIEDYINRLNKLVDEIREISLKTDE